jgi:hypothetical protein
MASDDFQVNLSDMTRSATHRLVRHILKTDTIASLPIHKRAEAKKKQEADEEIDEPSEIEEATEAEKTADLHAERGDAKTPKVTEDDFDPKALASATKKMMPSTASKEAKKNG